MRLLRLKEKSQKKGKRICLREVREEIYVNAGKKERQSDEAISRWEELGE